MCAYVVTLLSMSAERVTVSLPEQLKSEVTRIAEQRGVPFSTVVAEALLDWTRARLVDEWLAEHQAQHGDFDETELRALAATAGIPYLPPGRAKESAP